MRYVEIVLFLAFLSKVQSLTVVGRDNITFDLASYNFGTVSTDTSFVSLVDSEQIKNNFTALVQVTAPLFPFEDYVDRCETVGCLGVIFYAVGDLQTILEISAEAGLIRTTLVPIVALREPNVDVSQINSVIFPAESQANRFKDALHSRNLLFLLNAVLLHRMFNLVFCIVKFLEFYKARSHAIFPILVIICYIISSVVGIITFDYLCLDHTALISYRWLLPLMMLDSIVFYCGRIAMGIHLAQSRTRSIATKGNPLDAMKDYVTLLGFIIAVGSAIMVTIMTALPPGLFTFLMSLITLPHIIFIVFNARNTGLLVYMLLTNGRKLGLPEEQRQARMSFAWKAFGATLSGIITMILQVIFLIFQSWSPSHFLLILSLQSIAMSEVGLNTVAALKPAARAQAAALPKPIPPKATVSAVTNHLRPRERNHYDQPSSENASETQQHSQI